MATLKYSHFENWCGIFHDFYYCSECCKQYAFRSGTMPDLDKCEDCGAEIEGAEFNDQIGGNV